MATRKFEYYEKRQSGDGRIEVLGYRKYPRSSVLAGQLGKVFVESFDTEEEAEAKYGSMNWWNKWLSASPSVSHLPGEDDFVPGGAYPDDWD